MRIGIYDPYLDALSGGEKYMLTAAACLSENHNTFLFWDNKSILQSAQKKFDINLTKVSIVKNIFAPSIPFLERIKASRKYDAIFYLSDGSIPLVASKKLFLHFQFPVQWVQGKSIKNIIKMKRVSAVICNSVFTKNYIDKTYGVNSSVLYPPASENNRLSMHVKENIILSVGRYEKLPNNSTFKKQEILIDVFKRMVDSGVRNWKCVLVISFSEGEGDKARYLEEESKGYPIAFVKNASFEELSHLNRKAKIYWHAAGFGEDLEKHPERSEHFGIATVQAMEQGAVPIVINAGGQREIVDDNINGLLWNTKEELMDKTITIMTDEKKRNSFSLAAYEKSLLFSNKKFCEHLHSIIQ